MAALKNYKFDLRAKYQKSVNISLIISLILVISAFQFAPDANEVKQISTIPPDFIPISETDPTYQKPEIPPPPEKPKILQASVDELAEDVLLNDVSIIETEQIGPPPPPEIVEQENIIFVFAEKMPEPVGGMGTISEKIYYTEIAKRIGIQGQVIIEAIIDKEGNVINAELFQKIGGGLDEIALNAVLSTKFYPAEQRGKPVKVKMKIPVKFVLR